MKFKKIALLLPIFLGLGCSSNSNDSIDRWHIHKPLWVQGNLKPLKSGQSIPATGALSFSNSDQQMIQNTQVKIQTECAYGSAEFSKTTIQALKKELKLLTLIPTDSFTVANKNPIVTCDFVISLLNDVGSEIEYRHSSVNVSIPDEGIGLKMEGPEKSIYDYEDLAELMLPALRESHYYQLDCQALTTSLLGPTSGIVSSKLFQKEMQQKVNHPKDPDEPLQYCRVFRFNKKGVDSVSQIFRRLIHPVYPKTSFTSVSDNGPYQAYQNRGRIGDIITKQDIQLEVGVLKIENNEDFPFYFSIDPKSLTGHQVLANNLSQQKFVAKETRLFTRVLRGYRSPHPNHPNLYLLPPGKSLQFLIKALAPPLSCHFHFQPEHIDAAQWNLHLKKPIKIIVKEEGEELTTIGSKTLHPKRICMGPNFELKPASFGNLDDFIINLFSERPASDCNIVPQNFRSNTEKCTKY